MSYYRDNSGFHFMIVLLVLAGGILYSIWSAQMESAAYNRLTGAKTTTWDALFLELRVQDQPRPTP